MSSPMSFTVCVLIPLKPASVSQIGGEAAS